MLHKNLRFLAIGTVALSLVACATVPKDAQAVEQSVQQAPVTPTVTVTSLYKEEDIPVVEPVKIENPNMTETKTSDMSTSEIVQKAMQDNRVKVEDSSMFDRSVMRYKYQAGKIYDIYCTPHNVTDVRFGAGEEIIGYVLSDPSNWSIQWIDGVEGNGSYKHMLLQPLQAGYIADAVFSTNQRTYYFRLYATTDTAFVGLRFLYPDAFGNLASTSPSTSAAMSAAGVVENASVYKTDPSKHNYNYKIVGTNEWIPNHVYDDGKNTFIVWEDGFDTSIVAPSVYIKDGAQQAEILNIMALPNGYMIPNVLSKSQQFILVQGLDTCTITHYN